MAGTTRTTSTGNTLTAEPPQDAPTGDATNGVAPDTTNVQNGTDGEAGAAAEAAVTEAAKKVKRNPDEMGPDEVIGINVRIPNALRKLLADTAVKQSTSVPQLVATMLAQAYEFTLPKPARAPRIKKYENKEQRLAAQKAAQQKQRMQTKALLRLVEQGKIDVNLDELVAQMEAEQAANAPEQATETAGATS